MSDDDSLTGKLAAARPEVPRGVARQIALEGLLAAVVGDRPLPTIGRYRVEARVGEGGMGVVYRARDDERVVAIKLVDARVARERARFSREARLLREVVHPNVVAYLEHGVTEDDVDYLVMEWLEGRDLGRRVQAQGPLSVVEALRVVLAAARGLGAVHRAGIVHRDVKPSNLFLVGDELDAVRVVDFGVSRAVSSETQLTVSGAMVGTPSYAAPEQIRGLAGPSADVYGLGAVLFECLTGRPPFVGEHAAAVLSSVLSEPAPSVTAFRDDVPTEVDLLLARMLAKRPDDRPSDMEAVAVSVASLLAERRTPGEGRQVLSRRESVTPRRPITTLATTATTAATPATATVAAGITGSLVGRERESAAVMGSIAASHADEEAAWIEVVGGEGLGKTALLQALAPAGHVLRLRVSSASGPFDVAATMAAGFAEREPSCVDAAATFTSRLDETRSETENPVLVADRILLAWLDLVEVAAAADAAWTILLDDADEIDVPSARLLSRALDLVDRRPVAFVVTKRAEGGFDVAESFDLERRTRMKLVPLRERAATRLAASVRPDGDEGTWSRAAALGAGVPARVIIHATYGGDAHGSGEGSLDRLDPETRRVLRAAAIVGREFDTSLVARLVDADVGFVERHLARAPEIVARAPVWRFVSEAIHAATHARCTDDDRRAGHLAVASALSGQPRVDTQALAFHLRAAGEVAAAAPHHLALARGALAGGDDGAFHRHLACAREGLPADPRVDALDALARFWRGDVAGARDASRRAMDTSPVASVDRFEAASLLVTCAGQLGDDTTSREVALALANESPRDEATRSSRFVVLARAVSQRFASPDPTLDAEFDARRPDALTAEARAWSYRVDALRAREHLDRACAAHEAAHRAHAEQGDWRSAAQSALYLGSYRVWSGAWERAREAIDEALRLARRLGAEYLITWARYTEAKLLVELEPERALRSLDDVITKTASSRRMQTGAHVYAALAAQRLGEFDRAVSHAELAREGTGLTRVATSALVRAWQAMGRRDEAHQFLSTLTGEAREPELDELVRLALAELDPTTRPDALTRIETRAATIEEPLRRHQYLTRPHLVVATRALG